MRETGTAKIEVVQPEIKSESYLQAYITVSYTHLDVYKRQQLFWETDIHTMRLSAYWAIYWPDKIKTFTICHCHQVVAHDDT